MSDQGQSHQDRLVAEDMLANLPTPVQRYLDYTGVVGKPRVDSVQLKQTGRFRQAPDRPWMPMAAEQTYTTDPPGFVWQASFKLFGMPLLRARDEYAGGHGHMFGKLAGLITVFDARGERLDQGSMMRYLSEMIWFPAAFLGDNITWDSVDEYSAQVTLNDQGRSVSGIVHFDDIGKITNFTAERYREVEGDFSLDPWSTPITGYGFMQGLNLPLAGQAVWNLPEGDFTYIDLQITELRYNTAV